MFGKPDDSESRFLQNVRLSPETGDYSQGKLVRLAGLEPTNLGLMNFPYDETRAIQVAAWFIKQAGGSMNVIKLSKLIYIADREALKRWGRPIIGGYYSSMDHGPVISPVVNRLKPADDVYRESFPDWDRFFQRSGNDLKILDDPGRGRLHDAAIKLLTELYAAYGHLSNWELRNITHGFAEYTHPKGSSKPIRLGDFGITRRHPENGCQSAN
jgi:uncharacterized phage-associated protein